MPSRIAPRTASKTKTALLVTGLIIHQHFFEFLFLGVPHFSGFLFFGLPGLGTGSNGPADDPTLNRLQNRQATAVSAWEYLK